MRKNKNKMIKIKNKISKTSKIRKINKYCYKAIINK